VRRLVLIAAAVAAIGGGVWWFTRSDPIAVTLVTAERGPVAATVSNTRAGTVDACRRAGLSPAVGGQIASLPVTEGDAVRSGDLLLELWNDDMKAQLTLAERDARAARSRAREACVIAEVAQRDSDRVMTLREQRLASEEAADQAVGRAESTAAACAAAQDAARVAEARMDVARAQLEKTQLVAPFDGVIAEINGEIGEFVTPSPVGIPTPPTVDLIDSTCLYVSAPIDEVDAPRVRDGLSARISLDAFPDQTFAAHVRRVAPYVLDQERQARTVEIEAEFDDPAAAGLLAGYSADVEVVLDRRADTLRIPTSVILADGTVLVFEPSTGTLRAQKIERGLSNWEFTEVVSGLREGDRIVSSIDREGVAPGAAVVPE
jgi:HlyD family secretion protein